MVDASHFIPFSPWENETAFDKSEVEARRVIKMMDIVGGLFLRRDTAPEKV